jgi:hypothetical protein
MISVMSTGWNAPLEPRPRHDALVRAIVGLAQAAGARLAARDAGDGFLTLPGAQRANLASQGNRFGELCAEVIEAWRAAADEPAGAALAALGAIAARPEDKILLALVAALDLERGIGKALRFCAPDGRLTVGALLDLMSTSASNRMLLAGLLHPDAPLVASGALTIDRDAAVAGAGVGLAAAALAVLRGEPPPRPVAAESIGYRPEPEATALVDGIGLAGARPGAVLVLAGPRSATVPLLHLALLGRQQLAWLLPAPPAVVGLARDLGQWRRWALGAALGGRVLAVDTDGDSLDGAVVLAREVAATTGAAIALLTSAQVPAVDGPTLTVVPAGEVASALIARPAPTSALLAAMLAALRVAS